MGACSSVSQDEDSLHPQYATEKNAFKPNREHEWQQSHIKEDELEEEMKADLGALMGVSSGAILENQLEMFISLRNIPKLDLLSPSDAFCIISVKDDSSNQYQHVKTTQIVWDQKDPDFLPVKIGYKFEQVQTIKIESYDADTHDTSKLSDHDYIGSVILTIGDLVTAPGQTMRIKMKDSRGNDLVNKKRPVWAVIRCEEVATNMDLVHLSLECNDLPKMDLFGAGDPYLQIYRASPDGGWMQVAKTETLKNNKNPKFKPIDIAASSLIGNNDVHRPIKIVCWDWNRDAEPDLIGSVITSLDGLSKATHIAFRRRDKKTGELDMKKEFGILRVKECRVEKRFSFVQYLMGGLQVQLMVAIDFTGSNGDPRDRSSLHYNGAPKFCSEYLEVIKSVGRVLEPYDSDNMIPAYGFGANIKPPHKHVSHCFPLTFNDNNPEVAGIDGLIEAYKKTLARVQLYGPTYFSECINLAHSDSLAPQSKDEQHFTILLLITDGVLNDQIRTIDAIVDATNSPLSIIIVGVGSADFDAMEVLDADDTPLRHSDGRYMKRDIVQFVPFRQFRSQLATLAKETLEEIPEQVTSYFSSLNMPPNKPRLRKQGTVENLLSVAAPSNPNLSVDPYYSGASGYKEGTYTDAYPTAPYSTTQPGAYKY